MIFQSFEIQKAASLLKHGEVVAFPTETVYGLGASVFQPDAIRKIFTVKGRPSDNPLIVHISSFNQLELIVKELPREFILLADAFFPGPLTVLLAKQATVSPIVSAGLPTVGVRMPSHPLARQLIEAVGEPLVAPSANLSGSPSSTTAQHVFADFGDSIGGILDGGPCAYGLESTVVSLDPAPTILRPGAVTQAQLENVLKRPISFATGHHVHPLSPGMKYRHYAPRAKIHVFHTYSALTAHAHSTLHTKRTILTEIKPAEFYALLRQADYDLSEEILILCNKAMKKNHALMDRINRASQ